MHQCDDFHLIKQHPVDDAIRRQVNLPNVQIRSLMHWMPCMRMQCQNICAFDDPGHHSICIKR